MRPGEVQRIGMACATEQGVACLRDIIQTIEKHNEAFFPITEFRFIKGDGLVEPLLWPRKLFHCRAHGRRRTLPIPDRRLRPIYRAMAAAPLGQVAPDGHRELSAMYPKWSDFQAVRQQFDPQGRMLNAHLRKVVCQRLTQPPGTAPCPA